MHFQTNHPFNPSSKTVSVGTQVFAVLQDASQRCGHLVIDAPAALGAAYGWARATELDRAQFDQAEADAKAALEAKLAAMTAEEREAYDAAQAAEEQARQAAAEEPTAKKKSAPIKLTR